MTYLVYKHTSPSGKSYIGITDNYDKRCRWHQRKQSSCRAFYAAIQKYGWDNFTHEILYDKLTLEQANWREQQSINEYGTMAPYGYNLTSGGKVCKMSSITKQRICANHGNRGKTMSTAHKHLLISITTTRVISADERAQRSRSAYARRHTTAGLANIKAAAEKRASVPWQERPDIVANAKWYTITTPAGNTLTVQNLNRFCKEHDLVQSCMLRVANGTMKQYKGWTCSYLPA